MMLPKFRRMISFAKEISQNFVEYLFGQHDFAKILLDFAKTFFYFVKFHRIISFANEI